MKRKKKSKEEKKKSDLSLNIFGKKVDIDKKYLLIPFLLIIIFLINKKYFLFGVLTLLSGIFGYFHDRFNTTEIDFKMTLFLGIIITRYFGLQFTAIFFLLSDIIPNLLGGARIGGNSLFFYALFFILNSVVLLFPQVDIIVLGIILVIADFFGSTLIKSFFGVPIVMGMLSSALSVVVRIVYFLTLGEALRFLFEVI